MGGLFTIDAQLVALDAECNLLIVSDASSNPGMDVKVSHHSVLPIQDHVEHLPTRRIEVDLAEFEHEDVVTVLVDWDFVAEGGGVVTLRLVQDVVVLVRPAND